MKHLSFLFRFCVCIFLTHCIFIQFALSQELPVANTIGTHSPFSDGFFRPQSPDVWSMIKYGNANINHYSGTLGLSIPVYTYKDSDFEIPISIDYASNGYQPGVDCDVVGLGWYLNVGGAITREVHGIPDETRGTFDWKWMFFPLNEGVPDHSEMRHQAITVFGYGHLFNTENPVSTKLDYVYSGIAGKEYMPIWRETVNRGYGFETEPDIFHFSFLGHTGSFILQPNHQIRVFNTNTPAGEYEIEFLMNVSEPLESSFVITTGDKTKYYFDQTQKSTTQTSNWASSSDGAYTNYSWKLSKIEKPNGVIVQFNFAKTNCWSSSRNVSITVDRMTVTSGKTTTDLWKGEAVPEMETITTNASVIHDLTGININGKCQISFHYSSSGVNDHAKLDSITIYSPGNTIPIKRCYCSYAYSPGNNSVMFLKNVHLSGIGKYTMEYIEENTQFPAPDTYATDWYGYYNNNPITFSPSEEGNMDIVIDRLDKVRIPNSIYAKKGLLATIHYPTGGRSEFTYEPHTYSMLWGSNFKQNTDQLTGGLRIKQIDTFLASNEQTQCRRYIYNLENGMSSGVLLQKPGIYLSYNISIPHVKINREIISTLNNVGFSKNSHIEYLRIIEEKRKTPVTPLLSKTAYDYYSSSIMSDGNDVIDNYSLDGYEIHDAGTWSAEFETTHSDLSKWMLSSHTFIGKKLKSKTEYNTDNEILSYAAFQYTPLKCNDILNDQVSVPTLLLGRTGTHDYHTYSIYQSQTISKSYNENAELIFTDSISYSVDSLGRINTVVRTDSRGDEICDMYSYLDAVPAYPTEMIRTANGRVVSATKYDYMQSDNNPDHYVPTTIWKGAITPDLAIGNIEYRMDCTYDFYDSMGRPWEMTDRNGKSTCYIWGYEGQYLIAKIENMTYDVLSDQYGITNNAYPDTLPETEENMLRGIEGIAVTTYAYDPLVGITRITDPSGHSVYYEYNDSGKLKVIRDDKGKVLKSYDYHIVTDNQ